MKTKKENTLGYLSIDLDKEGIMFIMSNVVYKVIAKTYEHTSISTNTLLVVLNTRTFKYQVLNLSDEKIANKEISII